MLASLSTSLPSPSEGVVHLGPLPLRAYAFAILAGILTAVWLGERRWVARGGRRGTVGDVAVWAVPMGILGGRLYHVATSPSAYFGRGGHPLDALRIWQGGLGIWGAVALGAVGAWIVCRRHKPHRIPLPPFGDAIAPGIVLAQAIGRWGNWFNQELFGRPTDLPWGLRIDPVHRPASSPEAATYHPAFLYESLWDVGVAVLVIALDRRFRLGHGRAFALYVAAYCVGRSWIEALRVDDAEHFLGLRLNQFTAVVVFIGAVAYFVVSARLRPGRETIVEPDSVEEIAPDDAVTGESGAEGAVDADVDADVDGDADGHAAAQLTPTTRSPAQERTPTGVGDAG